MMIEVDILLWIAWGFGIVLTILALVPIIRQNRKSYNALNEKFIHMMVVLAIFQGGGFVAKYLFLNVMGLVEPLIPQNLRVDMITSFGLLAVLLHFSLYATGHRKHYGLPWIWYIFIMAFMVQLGNQESDIPVLSSAVVATALVILFLTKAIKNRSGLMLGIGFYIILNMVFALLNQYEGKNIIEEEIYALLGFMTGNLVLAMATWDIYDKYILFDRQKERAIRSSWIAKIMQTTGGKSEVGPIKAQPNRQVQRLVKCPACNASKLWLLPGDLIITREQSTMGIVKLPVPGGTTCDHAYNMYVDKSFQILGYTN
jgi:hypothetical protein